MDSRQEPRQYSISELEEECGLPRRTIHYYIQRELLPPAVGSGPTAFYTDEHLTRLRLIALWKDSSLQLRGIQNLLDQMSYADMQRIESELMTAQEGRGRWRSTPPSDVFGVSSPSPGASAAAMEDTSAPRPSASSPPRRRFGWWKREEESAAPIDDLEDSATWRRVPIVRGLEIHFRPGGGRDFADRVRQLIRFAHRIFAEEIRKERKGK